MEEEKSELTEEQNKQAEELLVDLFDTVLTSVKTLQTVIKENNKILESNYHHVGKIIHCHLVIENLINRILVDSGGHQTAKLPPYFSQKLELLPKEKKFYRVLIEGLEKFNQLRNKLAHNLNYAITSGDMEVIDKYLIFLKIEDTSGLKVEERIEKFTQICIFLFSMHSEEVRKDWTDFSRKHSSFYSEIQRWSEHLSLNRTLPPEESPEA